MIIDISKKIGVNMFNKHEREYITTIPKKPWYHALNWLIFLVFNIKEQKANPNPYIANIHPKKKREKYAHKEISDIVIILPQ